jgi:tetratricopeptide (TPR) repeat protein
MAAGRLIEARIELETAIALDPNNARALHQLGHTLRYLGEPEADIPYIEKAIRLNPRDPLILDIGIFIYGWQERSG